MKIVRRVKKTISKLKKMVGKLYAAGRCPFLVFLVPGKLFPEKELDSFRIGKGRLAGG